MDEIEVIDQHQKKLFTVPCSLNKKGAKKLSLKFHLLLYKKFHLFFTHTRLTNPALWVRWGKKGE
jgi:hypothetical protein